MAIKNTQLSNNELHTIFTKARNIFFIGIGGVSMRSLASFCAFCNKKVFGYDKVRTEETKKLEKIASVKYYSTPDNVSCMDLVIYTNAIDENNFEYRQAKRLKIPLVSRANFLGYVISLHKTKIGVAGMHGKSTTTSMLSQIFEYACMRPTVFCGAEMKETTSAYKIGGRECCIFEACEYQNSFLSLPTTDAVVLNIDYDHPDFFASIDEVIKSFRNYIKESERVYICGDCTECVKLSHPNVISFGFGKDNTYYAEEIDCCDGYKAKKPREKCSTFLVYKKDVLLAKCTLNLKGKHFILDALCAFCVAHTHGIAPNVIAKALEDFLGSQRRMEFIKKSHTGSDVFEDYAHHPAEIEASLSSLLEMGYKSILCVFQAHTYSRTYYLYDRFTKAFTGVKELLIAPIFSAREENIFELSEEDFARDCGGKYVSDIGELAKRINTTQADCVVLMGAGDLSKMLLPLI